jgi:hypothetical protein
MNDLAWKWARVNENGLYALTEDTLYKEGWNKAKCTLDHDAPACNCSCGFHLYLSLKELPKMACAACLFPDAGYEHIVAVAFQCCGRVFKGETTIRAEYIQPKQILAGSHELTVIAVQYGLALIETEGKGV